METWMWWVLGIVAVVIILCICSRGFRRMMANVVEVIGEILGAIFD